MPFAGISTPQRQGSSPSGKKGLIHEVTTELSSSLRIPNVYGTLSP